MVTSVTMVSSVTVDTSITISGMAAADIQKGVRQVIACKDPKTHRVGMAVENINKGRSHVTKVGHT